MHPYIVTGPETEPSVVLIDPRMSLSYLACRTMCDAAEVAQLNKRTFGCNITQAWPAFEHDVLVSLTNVTNVNYEAQLRGIAAAILMRKDVPHTKADNPLDTILKGSRALSDIEVPSHTYNAPPAIVPQKLKAPPKPKKGSALQSLLA